MAEKFKDDPDVIIAKMDATSNEVEGIKITIFPTMKFFPKDSNEVGIVSLYGFPDSYNQFFSSNFLFTAAKSSQVNKWPR